MPKREVTVIYSRNKVEAATKQTIHAEGFLQVNIPCSLREIGACKDCNQVVKEGHCALQNCESLAIITIHEPLTAIGVSAFSGCESLAGITIPDSVTAIGGYA